MAERSSLPAPDDGASDYVYRDGLSPTVKRCLLAGVIFFHVGAGWALSQVEPVKLIVGDIAPMEVRMVAAEEAAQPDPPSEEPPPPPEIQPPPPPPAEAALVIDPPPPDLPPPEFPLAMPDIPPPPEVPPPEIPLAKVELPPPPELPPPEIPVEPKPPKPKPPKPKPQAKPAPRRAPPAAPASDAQPQQQAAAPAAPRTVAASQLGYLVAPSPAYPARSRRAGEEGLVTVRVLVDITGRPAQVSLQKSSGHAALDEAAMSAVRAAQFRPYTERGLAQAVWVIVPINFVLR